LQQLGLFNMDLLFVCQYLYLLLRFCITECA
jgi:hypothetical protein